MATNFAIFDLGTPELLLILAIVLVLFGSKKLPELSRSIGESVKELKKGVSSASDLKSEVKSQVSQTKASLSAQPGEAERREA